jgi:hypothetical protein
MRDSVKIMLNSAWPNALYRDGVFRQVSEGALSNPWNIHGCLICHNVPQNTEKPQQKEALSVCAIHLPGLSNGLLDFGPTGSSGTLGPEHPIPSAVLQVQCKTLFTSKNANHAILVYFDVLHKVYIGCQEFSMLS